MRQNSLVPKRQRTRPTKEDYAFFPSLEWTLVSPSTSPANTAIPTTSFLLLGFSSLCVAGRGMYDNSHAGESGVGAKSNERLIQACLRLVTGCSGSSQPVSRVVPGWCMVGLRLVLGCSLRAPACPKLLPDISLAVLQAGPRLIRLVLVCSQAEPTCLKLLPDCSSLSQAAPKRIRLALGFSEAAPACPRLLPDISLAGLQAGPRLTRLALVCSQADLTCPRLILGCSGLFQDAPMLLLLVLGWSRAGPRLLLLVLG